MKSVNFSTLQVMLKVKILLSDCQTIQEFGYKLPVHVTEHLIDNSKSFLPRI